MSEAIAAVDKRHARLDLLVNSAGITRFVPHGDLDALDDALISRILDVNVRGVIASVRAALPLMRRGGGGAIVNISSIAGVTAMGSNIAYCASKAAVDNLTKSLARALAPDIRVVSVSPGLVDTEFVRGLDQSWRDEQAGRTPLRRLAEPEEVARAVLAVGNELDLHHRGHLIRGRRQASGLIQLRPPGVIARSAHVIENRLASERTESRRSEPSGSLAIDNATHEIA